MFYIYIVYIYLSGHIQILQRQEKYNIHDTCNHEKNVPFSLSLQWLCRNSCTWIYIYIYIYIYVYIHIAG